MGRRLAQEAPNQPEPPKGQAPPTGPPVAQATGQAPRSAGGSPETGAGGDGTWRGFLLGMGRRNDPPTPGRRAAFTLPALRVDRALRLDADNTVPGAGGDPCCDDERPRWILARRLFFPSVFLLVLVQTASGVAQVSTGAGIVAGDAILVVFAAVYVYSLITYWSGRITRFWVLYGLLIALWLAELPFAHGDAFVMCIFLAVLSIASLRNRALPVVAVIIAVSMFAPAAFPSWHEGVDVSALLSIGLVSAAMYSFFALVRANLALVEARTEVATLAAENERTRIARDLHDLLGHSLTTITVKAGLARRLADTDPARAAAEIAEVEELSRRTLNDVRAVVTHYRDVTLAGELAAGRELLRAAGIDAHLPTATDVVDADHQALFAWVVREGLTNVVRHAHATTCTVTFGTHSLDMVDNGIGGVLHPGNGLGGLRERVDSAGGTLEAGPLALSGWRVHVEVPAPTPA